MPKEKIGIRQLCKSFALSGGRRLSVLEDLSLSMEEGGFYSILGPSGCGKTTLLRIIAGIERPDSGEAVVHQESRGGSLSLIHQQNDLLPWLTVGRNIEVATRRQGRSRKAREELVAACLEKVGLRGFHAFYPSQISGGMQKRASLARALASDSQVILCDEPLAFLDYQSRLDLQGLISALYVQQGKTIVYVTHDIYEAVALSRRTVILSALPGRIKTVIDVPFEYPRDIEDLKLSKEYRGIIGEMKETLREEVVKTDEMVKRRILERRRRSEGSEG